MPRQQQIIPVYDVPHVMTVVNNYSTIAQVEQVQASDPNVKFICVFPADKGEDGCKTINSTTEFINTYGYPNFKKYGQASFMPYLLLRSGYASVHCVRITPPNATYANIVILATVTTTDNTVSVKYSTSTIADLTDLETFEEKVKALATTDTYPVIAFASSSRGVYGNNLRFRMTSDTSTDNGTDYKNYAVQFLSTDAGLSLNENYNVTLHYSAVVSGVSKFMYDVLNDPEAGSANTITVVNDDGIDAIYTAYTTACEGAGTVPVPSKDFDYFYGRVKGSRTGEAIANYTIDADSVAFDSTTGLAFVGGVDGNFDMANESVAYDPDAPTGGVLPGLPATTLRQASIINEYLKAMFTGIDTEYLTKFTDETGRRYGTAVISKRRAPADVILDANYPDIIKKALNELAIKRADAKLILDSGIHSTVASLEAWDDTFATEVDGQTYYFASSDIDTPTYVTSREGQWFKARDPFTGKIIDVTYTWYLATALPRHIIVNGNHIPFTGERYALLSGAIANSLRPNIDADDLETKQRLYTRRINTCDTLAENTYFRSTQINVQQTVSDLLEDNNVMVLLEMKRMLEDLVLSKLYDFSEAEDRARFTESAQRMFETYTNRKVRSFNVLFDMNEFEEERNILHCYLELVFRQMSSRGIVEIDINGRV